MTQTSAQQLRVAFAGTPEFAVYALRAILAAGFTVPLVLTQPDRPGGRGMRAQASAVKQLALESGIAFAQPQGLRLDGRFGGDAAVARQALELAAPDVMVVAAYGLILPPWALQLPRLGCLNVHGSLLPRWRGAAPIQRAIEAGDATTGITIIQMDAGLDTGDMLLWESLPIRADETAATLHDGLAMLGGRLIVEALMQATRGSLQRKQQPLDGVTYASKITKAEGAIDWTQAAALIERRLRAFDPFPGATSHVSGEAIKCWRAIRRDAHGEPGQVLAIDDVGVTVACGEGALCLTELQRAGAKRLPAQQFLRGRPIAVGDRFVTYTNP